MAKTGKPMAYGKFGEIVSKNRSRRLMISHVRFGKLRLAQFLPDAEIAELDGWEFMDHIWVGEAMGFSEWLRLEDSPKTLRSLSIDFSEFPEEATAKVLGTIGLPLRRGMKLKELRELLGKSVETHRFVKDRVSYEFVLRAPPRYDVSCTVLNKGGLTYLVVMAPLPKRRTSHG
jgi:hypothetical protein